MKHIAIARIPESCVIIRQCMGRYIILFQLWRHCHLICYGSVTATGVPKGEFQSRLPHKMLVEPLNQVRSLPVSHLSVSSHHRRDQFAAA